MVLGLMGVSLLIAPRPYFTDTALLVYSDSVP